MNSTFSHSMIHLEHPSVRQVLAIAEEFIENNKILNIEILYRTAKKRLKIPPKGLLEIIQYLIKKRILVDGSKQTKKTVLHNTFRRKIYNAIRNKKKETGIKHLEVLSV